MNRTESFSFRTVLRLLPLLISTGAALCLFLTTSKITILLEAAIFLLVVFTLILEGCHEGRRPFHSAAALLACCFDMTGFYTFFAAWRHSGILGTLAGMAGLSPTLLAAILGALGAAIAWFAFYRLALWMDGLLLTLWGSDPDYRNPRQAVVAGLSSLCFFLLMPEFSLPNLLYALSASAMAALAANRAPCQLEAGKRSPKILLVFAALSSLGICLFRAEQTRLEAAAIPLAILGFFFVFGCTAMFFRFLTPVLQNALKGISKKEGLFYTALLLVMILIMAVIFLHTDAFYGTEHPYDVIYTSDSPILVGSNTWLNLTYSQNDLRQPLFAVFAAPFVGIFHLLDVVTGASGALSAILLNIPQLGILMLTFLLLGKMLCLSGWKRMVFTALCLLSYPSLLFSLMMEQYVFAVFYLLLFLSGDRHPLPFWGAAGTLLTSVVTVPLLSRNHPVKQFRLWYRDMLQAAMAFVILLIAFCRLDIILGVADQIVSMGQFTGEALTLGEKLKQYLAFVPGCFTAPAAGVDLVKVGHPSWQLAVPTGFDLRGILIPALCALSLVLNRKKEFSRIAGLWAAFSILLLFFLGWGTQENGLILYALYFGWAFLVLLWQLAEETGRRLKLNWFLPLVSGIGILVLSFLNLPAIAQMLRFALTHYPL